MAQVSALGTDPSSYPYGWADAPRHGAVLIVEDRDGVRDGIQELLELHGFQAIGVPDGQHALDCLLDDPSAYALILLDLILPGRVSGIDFRARQLAVPELSIIPTVVVSACEPDAGACEHLHPAGWLEKPFRVADLLEVVRSFVVPGRH
jgi:DNA-binding response OmpR family regulator